MDVANMYTRPLGFLVIFKCKQAPRPKTFKVLFSGLISFCMILTLTPLPGFCAFSLPYFDDSADLLIHPFSPLLIILA